MTPAFLKLHELLWQAGIPVAYIEGRDGAAVITYGPEATAAQKSQGASILAAFDWQAPAQAEATANTNRLTLEQQAVLALADNKVFYQRTSSTTAQVLAQVKALSRQNNGLIRMLLKRLDGTD